MSLSNANINLEIVVSRFSFCTSHLLQKIDLCCNLSHVCAIPCDKCVPIYK